MKNYLSITKPGIIFGNVVTMSGGFFLGAYSHFNFNLFFITLFGMCLVIAGGCVFNNVIDRDIDALMERTKNRALVKGLISPPLAIIYGAMLSVVGLALLYFKTNVLTAGIALLGLFVYVVAYSLLSKRYSSLGTFIGGISGAVPPLVGYCAVTNQFDAAAIILFLILFFWQMPHFYAIAIYRLKDYSAASIPLLPIKRSIPYTKVVMLIYTVLYAIVSVMPTILGYIGITYFVVALMLGLIWTVISIQGFFAKDDLIWARKMFVFSIFAITLQSFMMLAKV